MVLQHPSRLAADGVVYVRIRSLAHTEMHTCPVDAASMGSVVANLYCMMQRVHTCMDTSSHILQGSQPSLVACKPLLGLDCASQAFSRSNDTMKYQQVALLKYLYRYLHMERIRCFDGPT